MTSLQLSQLKVNALTRGSIDNLVFASGWRPGGSPVMPSTVRLVQEVPNYWAQKIEPTMYRWSAEPQEQTEMYAAS